LRPAGRVFEILAKAYAESVNGQERKNSTPGCRAFLPRGAIFDGVLILYFGINIAYSFNARCWFGSGCFWQHSAKRAAESAAEAHFNEFYSGAMQACAA
jgi:hypothetical protein